MPVFIDFTSLTPIATNEVLEFIFKASNNGGDGIWSPHESVLIRRIVELFTKNGLDRLAHIQQAILDWQSGKNHNPDAVSPPKPGMMVRWTPEELTFVQLYLEALPPEKWTLDDHMMSVEFVVQRYLPAEQLTTEAEWLATKSALMGKVQANMAKEATPAQADILIGALPSTPDAAAEQFKLDHLEKTTLEFAAAKAVEHVQAISEDIRQTMRGIVLSHVQEKTLTGQTQGRSLQGQLLDAFANLNRDWRRIAVTEAGECQLQGLIASLPFGAKVKRIEQYGTACGFCKKIHDQVCEVVDPADPNKDGQTQVWVGKNNIGRSGSPRKRVGDELIERTESELWWIPAGTVHPHCRGRWVVIDEPREGDDPEFAAWLDDLLSS